MRRKMRENTSLIIQSHQTIHIYAYTQFIAKTAMAILFHQPNCQLAAFFRNKCTKLDDYIKLAITYETDSRITQNHQRTKNSNKQHDSLFYKIEHCLTDFSILAEWLAAYSVVLMSSLALKRNVSRFNDWNYHYGWETDGGCISSSDLSTHMMLRRFSDLYDTQSHTILGDIRRLDSYNDKPRYDSFHIHN